MPPTRTEIDSVTPVTGLVPKVLITTGKQAEKRPAPPATPLSFAPPATAFTAFRTPFTGAGRQPQASGNVNSGTRITSRGPGPTTPRVQADRVAAAAQTFNAFPLEDIRHAFAWSVGAAVERQEKAVFRLAALRGELRRIESGFDRDTIVIRDGTAVLNSMDSDSLGGHADRQGGLLLPHPSTFRALLSQLVYEQHALPCGHPDLVSWKEGTRVFAPYPEGSGQGSGEGQGSGSG